MVNKLFNVIVARGIGLLDPLVCDGAIVDPVSPLAIETVVDAYAVEAATDCERESCAIGDASFPNIDLVGLAAP